MRTASFTAILFCFLLVLAAPVRSGENVLHVFTWEGYFSPAAIRLFEEKFDCTVDFEYYDSNDTMFEKLMRGGGYDVITPVLNFTTALNAAGMLRPLDHSLLPNLKYVDRRTSALIEDRDMTHSVPYTVTVTGVAYNKKMISPDALDTWEIFNDYRFAGKMTMLNDSRETIGAALKLLGYDINTTNPDEVREAGRVVRSWKRNLAMFTIDDAREKLVDGSIAAAQTYNGDAAQIMRENPDISFFVPWEGSAFNSDDLAICADAEQHRLAHAFINHFLDPDIAAMNIRDTLYYMPNTGAEEKVASFIADHPAFNLSPEIRAKCEIIKNLGAKREIYDQVWEEVLIGD